MLPASMPPDGFEDDGPPDGFEDDIASPQKQPGMLSKMVQGAGQALDIYGKSQLYSPQDWMNRTDAAIRSGANKAGEFVAEQAGRSGINPNAAAAMGTFMQMTPDLLETAVTPQSKIVGPTKLFRSTARPMAQRSLGLSKRFLNTPFARREANLAADVALEKKVIPFSGNPAVAFDRASALSSRSGANIGKTLSGIKFHDIAPDAEFELEQFRTALTKGAKAGLFSGANNPIDTVKRTIIEMFGRDMTANDYNKAKNILGNSINYLADNASQSINKRLVNRMAETLRASVKRIVPESFEEFIANQRDFNASTMMLRGLNNELAGQAGNNAASLPTMVAGAGQLATGNLPGAMTTLGVVEGLRRRGAGMTSRSLDSVGGWAGRQLMTAREPLRAGMLSRSLLSPEPGRDSSFQSGRKFKGLFNKPQGPANGIPNAGNGQMGQPNDQRNEQGNQNNNNGNLKSEKNHTASKTILTKRIEKVLTDAEAKNYLKKAKGDRSVARRMAIADGWTIPE